MGWEGDGTLESLREKRVVLIDGVHLTPSANIFAAISVSQIVGKGDTGGGRAALPAYAQKGAGCERGKNTKVGEWIGIE